MTVNLSNVFPVFIDSLFLALKEAVKLANSRQMAASPLERGVAGGSIMGKVRIMINS